MADDKKNIPDTGKVDDSPKPGKVEPAKAVPQAQDQPAPVKAVRKVESRHIKATADYHYRMATQEHPEMQGNALSRLIQKQKIKRQYAKQAREDAK